MADLENDRKYIIVMTSDLYKVDFSEVIQNEGQVLRKNSNSDKCILKWDYDGFPSFLPNLTYYDGPFNNEEIINILSNDW